MSEPRPKPSLVGQVIAWCALNPWITVVAVAVAAMFGVQAMRSSALDASPDLSDAQVVLFTEWHGRSPDLVEDQITTPLSTALLSTPRVQFVRGQSMFGMSFVTVVFEDGTDLYWARSRVLELLAQARDQLPEGANPALGPDASGVGWVLQYALVDRTGQHDLAQLRALQDFDLRYALQAVEGVAEVASVGGFVQEYQVQLDPDRLRAHGVTVPEVVQAVRRSNADAGGQSVEVAGHEQVVRSRGLLGGVADLERVPVKLGEDGAAVRVRDIAWVGTGPGPRRGFAELNGEGEVVGAIVVMRSGENALRVIERVKERLDQVRLPDGVELVITYDRSDLIERAIGTLRTTLIEEMVVISVVILVFLLHLRSVLVPVLMMPIAVAMAFIPMQQQGLTANIMSLGGIAVAVGAMEDGSIVIIENVHKALETWEAEGRPEPRSAVVIRAMQEVGPSIFFSLLVITVSFLPVFTLEAVEGRMFKPLAYTKTWSMAFAALLAITLTPALVMLLVRGRIRREEDNPVNRLLIWLYEPVVRLCVRFRWWVVAGAAAVVLGTVPAFLSLGSEFMPPLREGSLLFMPTAPPGMGATEAGNVMQAMGRAIAEVPEVRTVFGKMGRAETATDPAPMGMAETTIEIAPESTWREGLTWEGLIEELDAAVTVPGMPNLWWMPIQTRTEMLTTGIRSPLGVQVFGDSLPAIEQASIAIEQAVMDLEGTRSAVAERSTGGFYLDIDVDREAAGRHGLNVQDIHEVVEAAVGGLPVTQVYAGRARYPVTVRYARGLRDDLEALGQVLVPTPSGAQVPLAQVATLQHRTGPPMIRSEGGRLVGFVFIDPGEVPIADWVERARPVVEALDLPAGVRIDWVGQFKHLERARSRLWTVVPITLGLVAFLLWVNTGSLVETGVIFLAVPFSLVGAVWLMWALDMPMSIAAWVGLIALAGLDAETGVVMLLYLSMSWKKGREAGTLTTFDHLREAIVDGAARRIRPKLMTVLTALLGLTPILLSTGTGADVMRRVATPMVGGLVTSFLLELTVYPAIFAIWKQRELRREAVAALGRPTS